jgi:cytochrome c5
MLAMSPAARTCGVILAGVLIGGAIGTRAVAQVPDQRIWDGVFTAEQAQRGKKQFETNCGACHGAPGAGGSDRSGPALIGAERFMKTWEFSGLNQLVSKVFDQMPQGYPSNVEDAVKLDIISYILQSNGFPAGSKELGADLDTLREIQIVRKGSTQAPGEVANFALVQVVGCLTEGPNSTWIVTKTTEPIATTSPDPSSAQMLKSAGDRPLGAATFQLVNAARLHPEPHVGHKIEAKGLLYRVPNDARISVSSLQTIAPACGS